MKQINQPKIRGTDYTRPQYILADILKDREFIFGDVLDYGAGNGEYAERLRSKGASVDCFEPNKDSKSFLKVKGFNVIKKLEKKYDWIFMLDVIEHLIEPDKVLEQLSNHLKEDGKIIITTPNYTSWRKRILFLFGDISTFKYPNKHFSFFEKGNLRDLTARYFKEKKLIKWNNQLGYLGVKE